MCEIAFPTTTAPSSSTSHGAGGAFGWTSVPQKIPSLLLFYVWCKGSIENWLSTKSVRGGECRKSPPAPPSPKILRVCKIPYQWFRYALLVPTVAWVHFSNLKALVCILISTGSTWHIGTKCRYVIPQGFGSQMCTLKIHTMCPIDTVTKVVEKIKQGHHYRPNNGPIFISNIGTTLPKTKEISKHKSAVKKVNR